ncbi:acylphosphatase [Cytophagaceae bacterium ABcell3]|nr:acylphosphatase [Cytophagaceae bacterium ABcell3]
MKHLTITVTGKVQGVYYRASAREKALELGLKGLVKNMSDGSVYIEAEGPEEKLEEFVRWCKKGPVLARVSDIDVKEGSAQDFASFVIDR